MASSLPRIPTPGRSRSPAAAVARSRPAAVLLAVFIAIPTGCLESPEARLAEIRAAQEAGSFRETIGPLREILADDPDGAEANWLLGRALFETGNPSAAIWPLRKAAGAGPRADDAGILLARALLRTGNYEEATTAADAVLARDAGRSEAWLLRARARAQLHAWSGVLEDTAALLARNGDDEQALGLRATALRELGRLDEAREAFERLRELAEARGDVVAAARSCTAAATTRILADQPAEEDPAAPIPKRPSPEKASPEGEAALRACAAAFPAEPSATQNLVDYLNGLGRTDEAREVLEAAVAKAPEVFAYRRALANQLWLVGEPERAAQVLEEAVGDFGNTEAYEALADIQRLRGDFEAAAATLERATAAGVGSESLRFKRADLLVSLGRHDEALRLAEGFTEPAYRHIIEARVALERGEPAQALDLFERGLERWPDNAGARALAGRAAQELGDFERALAEYREAVRADAGATDAGLAAARLALGLGRYADAMTYAAHHVRSRPYDGPAAYLAGARAADASGSEQGVSIFLTALARQPGGLAHALAERARLLLRRGKTEEARRVLEQARLDWKDPSARPALRALVEVLIAEGRGLDALARLASLLEAAPEDADLFDLRGRVLLELGRVADAETSFRRALEIDPEHAGAHAGIGIVLARRGDGDAAIHELDRATALDPDQPESAYRAAQLVLAAGDLAAARDRLQALLHRFPGHAGAANDLAWVLASHREDLDRALELAERAWASEPGPAVADTLATVQLVRGEPESALALLDEALQRWPDDPTLHFRRGRALVATGREAEARAEFERALSAGSFPEAEAAREALAVLARPPVDG